MFACHKCGKPVPNVHIDIQSDIPFARGLGSSSQCVVAGILGANAIAELEMDHDQLLACAVEIEGHPDNVAPALNGALSVTVEGTRSLIGVNLGPTAGKPLWSFRRMKCPPRWRARRCQKKFLFTMQPCRPAGPCSLNTPGRIKTKRCCLKRVMICFMSQAAQS
ncbi:hypothetical protein KWG61_12315 [Allobaculum sp. Allo2]|nr:hypothetical protein KWG61_12315 [Allobaculum sp. Allo2]